jgi:hypothetical protein
MFPVPEPPTNRVARPSGNPPLMRLSNPRIPVLTTSSNFVPPMDKN